LPPSALSYRVRRYLDLFEEFYGTGRPRVLDVGCGSGRKISCFGSLVGQSVGIDLPAEVSQIGNCDLMRVAGNADSFLPFPDDSFDAVTSFHVIEHLKERDMAIEEMFRVLKPGGWLLLLTPNRRRVTSLYSNFFLKILSPGLPYPYPMNPDHTFEYARSDLQTAFQKSKFRFWRMEAIFLGLAASYGSKNIWIGLDQVPDLLSEFCAEWIVMAQKQE
jgi:SAM-dependent methyltransferase